MRRTGVDSCYWCRNWLVHIGVDFRSFWNEWWYSDKTQFPSIFDSIYQWMEISDCERKLILVSPHWIVLQCLLLEHFSKIVGLSPDSSSICFLKNAAAAFVLSIDLLFSSMDLGRRCFFSSLNAKIWSTPTPPFPFRIWMLFQKTSDWSSIRILWEHPSKILARPSYICCCWFPRFLKRGRITNTRNDIRYLKSW